MRLRFALLATILSAFSTPTASAAPIGWVQWLFDVPGSPGIAIANLSGFGDVFYQGQLDTIRYDELWQPTLTFGAGSDRPPFPQGGMVLVNGSSDMRWNSISFSRLVIDPYFAIWSLGRPGEIVPLAFLQTPAAIDSGGPSLDQGGTSIIMDRNLILGEEGNGVFHFDGVFRSIGWYSLPTDDSYGFTVGARGVILPCAGGLCDEPLTLSLLAGAIAVLGMRRRRVAA